MKALLAMPEALPERMFDAAQLARLAELIDIDTSHPVPDLAAASDQELADVEVLVTGWGSPCVDASELARMPRLRAISTPLAPCASWPPRRCGSGATSS